MQKLEFFLAWRYLRGKKRKSGHKPAQIKDKFSPRGGFLSFVSYIAIGGIALGVWSLIVVMSVMNGFQREIKENVLGVVSHATIKPFPSITLTLDDWDKISRNIQENNHVIASAPFIEQQGLVTDKDNVRPVTVRGITPKQEIKVADFVSKPLSGDIELLDKNSFRAMIGIDLAKTLGINVGDKFTLITPQGSFSPVGLMPRLKRFEVAGIFQAGMYEYDMGLLLINIHDAAKLYQIKNGADALRVRFDDVLKAHIRTLELNTNLPNGLYAQDWSASHANFFRAVQIEKRMMFLILTIIIAVASFNVVNQQMMLISEKTGDIAILRTLGVSSGSIVRLFLFQGFILGAIGIFSGLIVGMITAINVEEIVSFIESLFRVKFLSPEVYQIPVIPSQLLATDVITTAIVSFSIILIATIYPSFRAAKIIPAETLRYE